MKCYYPDCNKKTEKKSVYCRLHRLIINASEGDIADHISRNKLDNRKINIRLCTSSQNSMNRSKLSINTSGHTGVGWNKNENM